MTFDVSLLRSRRVATPLAVLGAYGAVALMAPASHAIGYDIQAGTPAIGTNVVVTIPSTVCSVDWEIAGGSGGNSPGAFAGTPGYGGGVQASTPVTPGSQLMLQVGEAGTNGTSALADGGRSGAALSGGSTAASSHSGGLAAGGAGGGATIVRSGPSVSDAPLLVAGGGGGAGSYGNGGNAGPTGSDGGGFVDGPGSYDGGGGATGSAAGGAGAPHPSNAGTAGSPGSGSRGGNALEGSGGGGGGRYGAGSGSQEGAGAGAGGGGGSNFAPSGATSNFIAPGLGDGYIQGTYGACPAPPAPTAAHAVAGTSSVTASWAASSPSTGVSGYTVHAHPGAATCETHSATDTSCVFGGTAGTEYTFTVTAHATGGDSADSTTSNAVTPAAPVVPAAVPADAPVTLTTDRGQLQVAQPAQRLTILGTGFAAYSTAKVAIYSMPTELGTVTADANGDFSIPVTIPAGLAPGSHTFLATGVDPQGHSRAMELPVTVLPKDTNTTGNGVQSTTLAIPAGAAITLLDAAGTPASSVTLAGQGTYRLDAATGTITFTPIGGFSGRADTVAYRVTDRTGTAVTGTYAATVGATPAAVATTPTPAAVTAKRCAITRTLKVRWTTPRSAHVTKVVLRVNGKAVKTVGGDVHSARLRLSAGGAKVLHVTITATTRDGRLLSGQRLRSLCGAKKPAGYTGTTGLVLKATKKS